MNITDLVSEQDIVYEEDILRNPYSTKAWIRYFNFKQKFEEKVWILSRAVKMLPRSYKLWKLLLDLKVNRILLGEENELHFKEISKDFAPNHPEWQITNGYFEKCLVLCNKFPVIWQLYCHFLMHQKSRITFTRRTFDRALKALPVTQHKKLWEYYLSWANLAGGETTVRVWRRFLKVQPSQAERYVNTLLGLNPPRTAEAARVLTAIIESPVKFANPNGKTTYQYWSQLCQIIVDHPDGIEMPQQDHLVPESEFSLTQRPDRLDVELILRAGIQKFSDQVGALWNSLAKWWILQGNFERARDVYEEGIRTVNNVKDFTLIFDAYTKMEEDVLSAAMDRLANIEAGNNDDDEDVLDGVDVDLRLARFERLMDRRPFLMNDVLLRQNRHNVMEWQNRVKLYLDLEKNDKVIETYNEACRKISPHRAAGSATAIWIDFAKFHEDRDELDEAREVFGRAVKVEFKTVDELATIWCEWAEMEIRNGDFKKALQIVGMATAPTSSNLSIHYNDNTKSVKERLFKNVKLWSFYIDLEESVGTIESTKAVYDRVIELKIVTPQIIINYAAFLEEHGYYEESFRVYERGVELFGYPIAFEIWNLYLTKFISRYEGTKLERTRDLFEQALEKCPANVAKGLYLLYAKLEEDYGLAMNCVKIYERAIKNVSPADLYDLFVTYIAKVASFFGIIATRDIYTKALEVLPDKSARDMAIKFMEMEVKLGEVDRARSVLAYISQLCDPRIDPAFWKVWHEFEVKYGNEDTYKEMLRIKRSVQSKYNSDVNFLASQILASRGLDTEGRPVGNGDENTKVSGFVRAQETEPQVTKAAVVNPDEIALDASDDEDEEVMQTEGKDVENKNIPAAVFGGLAAKADENKLNEPQGAKERFKRKAA